MKYYIACLHVNPNNPPKNQPRGLWISKENLTKIAARAPGAPFTYNHRGVHEAVAIIGKNHITPAAMHRTLAKIAERDPSKAAIGSVTEAFIGHDGALWCILIVDDTLYVSITAIIDAGITTGVSLTHIEPNGPKKQINDDWTAVEVALTNDPARKGANITFASHDLQAVTLYANAIKEGRINSSPTMADEPTDDIASILNSLAPASKLILEVTPKFISNQTKPNIDPSHFIDPSHSS